MLEHLKLGFFYTAIGKYSNVLIQLLVNIVLSRLLTPEQFGIVAVVQVFLVFFSLLVDAGLGPAIIENKTLTAEDDKILFRYGIRLGFILAGVFIACGPVICILYNNWGYMGITAALGVTLLFQGFNTVPNALLDKAKRFKEVNMRLILGNLFGGIAGVAGAFYGLGAYALVLSSAVPAVIAFILNVYLLRISPSRHTSRTTLNKVLNFAKNQFGFNFINYFSRNADNLLIGKFMGPTPLANYSKAYQLLMMPNNVLLGVINPVLQPVLSDYKNDIPKVRAAYLQIVKLLAFIGMPLSVFLSVEAHDIIFVLFGNQWGAAVPPFQVLALTVWIQMTLSSSGAIYQAMNKSHWLFRNGLMSMIIIVTGIIIGVAHGTIFLVSISLSISFVINFVMSFSMLMRTTLSSNFFSIIKCFPIPAMTAIFYAIPGILVNQFTHSFDSFPRLLLQTAIFVTAIVVAAFLSGYAKMIHKLFK